MLFISYLHLIEGIGCRCGVIQEMVFFLNNAVRDIGLYTDDLWVRPSKYGIYTAPAELSTAKPA